MLVKSKTTFEKIKKLLLNRNEINRLEHFIGQVIFKICEGMI